MSPNRVCVLLLLLGIATERGVAQTPETSAAAPKALGKVLMLESERCVAGDVELVGAQYCVRQGKSEIYYPANKVLRVCPDWHGAYTFVKTRANLDDPDERLRIARWCQTHNLLVEALAEAKVAQELRPSHTPTHHLAAVLQKALEAKRAKVSTAAPVVAVDRTPPLDVSHEASAHFTTRIQPILMNTCVSCHAGGKGGSFQLYRPGDGGTQAALQRNLKSVLSQVRFDNVALSPLLIKAANKHGGAANSPLPGKKSIPYQSLEAWVKGVIATHPHLREQMAPPEAVAARGRNDEGADRFGETSTSVPEPAPRKSEGSVTPSGKTIDKSAPRSEATKPTDAPRVVPPMTPAKTAEGPRAGPAGAPMVDAPRRDTPAVDTTRREAPGERDIYSADDFNRVVHPKR